MGIYRFVTGKRFRWQEITYEITQLLPNEKVNLVAITTGEVLTVTQHQLVEELYAGRLRFAIKDTNGEGVEIVTQREFISLDDCSPRQQAEVRFRFWVIEPLCKIDKSNRTRQNVIDRVQEVEKLLNTNEVPVVITFGLRHEEKISTNVSTATVYRWLQAFEQSAYDLRSLISNTHKRGRHGRVYIVDAAEEIMKTTIEEMYLRREKHTIDDVYREILLRIDEENAFKEVPIQPPHRRTVARRIENLGLKTKFRARRGKREADYEYTQFGEMPYPERPLIRVEIDHTKIDLIVIDAEDNLPLGRPTLTFCLDTATRYPLGFYLGFEPPSYLSVLECLNHAIRPKGDVKERYGTQHDWIAHGLPRSLIVDNGREFIGRDLEDACLQLGIQLQFTPVRMPYFKAAVERFFGTSNTGLFHTLPGTTFSNIFQRGDYQSLKTAVLTLGDIDRILNIFMVDIYAEKFHRGLQGIPARRWENFLQDGFSPRHPANIDDLEILLGRLEYRSIHNYGIELFNLRYNRLDARLAVLRTKLKQEQVKVKYHPGDLSRIHIFDPFEKEYLELPAVDQAYTKGLSLWKHRVITAYMHREKGRVDEQGLGLARREIQDIVSEAKKRSKMSTRSKMARWETAGRPAGELDDDTPKTLQAVPSVVGSTQADTDIPQANSSPTIDDFTRTDFDEFDLEFDLSELEKAGWGVVVVAQENETLSDTDKE